MLHIKRNIHLPPITDLLLYDKSDSSEDEEGIELPPLQDIHSPSPALQPMHPRHYEQYSARLTASPASSTCSDVIGSPDSPFTIIKKCRHLHGRSLSADYAGFSENPPWISEPLRIITAVGSPPAIKRKPITATRKYACHYCRKAFTRPSSLRTHTYSHTGQKPFACAFKSCDKRFSVLSNMRRHMRRHSSL